MSKALKEMEAQLELLEEKDFSLQAQQRKLFKQRQNLYRKIRSEETRLENNRRGAGSDGFSAVFQEDYFGRTTLKINTLETRVDSKKKVSCLVQEVQ